MGLTTPFHDLPVADNAVKATKKVDSHTASDLHRSCLARDLRVTESSALWPSGATPSAKEGLLWAVSNHCQKKRSASANANEIDKKKKKRSVSMACYANDDKRNEKRAAQTKQ